MVFVPQKHWFVSGLKTDPDLRAGTKTVDYFYNENDANDVAV